MDPGSYAGLVELVPHCVPLVRLDHIQMVDVRRPLLNERRLDPRLRQFHGVPLRSAPPIGVPFIQAPQLDLQDCRLESIEPAVEPDLGVAVVAGSTVVTQSFDPLGDRGTVGSDRSAVAIGPEVLRRIKRETCDIAERPGSDPLIFCSVRLGRVFYYIEPAPPCDVLDWTHVSRLAEEVDCDDRSCTTRDD